MKIVAAKCVASLVGVAGILVGVARLHACGPWLPEQILVSRQVVLRTPVGDFAQEVMALTEEDGAPKLPPGLLRAPPSPSADNAYVAAPSEEVAASEEASELSDALAYYKVPAERRDNLVVAYKSFRDELRRSTAAVRKPRGDDGDNDFRFDEHAQGVRQAAGSVPKPPPAVLPPALAEGLPGEWADYLQGAYCFWRDDLDGARVAWERLLARPPAQRLYCSTWAAYMLARIVDEPDAPPEDNARRYQRVRQLRAEGCRDLFNLASESLGWEARLAYVRHDQATAARLYYLQGVSGGGGNFDVISSSLRAVAQDALGHAETTPEAMAATARDPFLRRVITLYLACHRAYSEPEPPPVPDATSPGGRKAEPDPAATERRWLAVLSDAGVNVVREAASVAWTAYQQADYQQAAAWLAKAPADDGLALWLRAKLALRAGKTDEAAGFFARAVRSFPVEIKDVDNNIDYSTQLALDGAAFRPRQFQADLGIVNLSRHDYEQALAALLRSGFWRDAAYVAERVLTPDELRAYVQRNFPRVPAPSATPKPSPTFEPDTAGPPTPTQAIQASLSADHSANPAAYSLRYLLARCLSRDGRYAEAREYYPAPLWPKFDEYVAARKLGDTDRQPKDQRADALWRAAKIERWLGMELFGSEDEPDWFVEGGSFDDDYYRDARLGRAQPGSEQGGTTFPAPTPTPPYVPPVSADEKRRVEKEQVHPEKRYHYRYLAADLAWKAASLMADQQEQTARVLAAGGFWLMSVHEDKAADKFHAAILRRCGQTTLGREAAKTGGIPAVPHEDP